MLKFAQFEKVILVSNLGYVNNDRSSSFEALGISSKLRARNTKFFFEVANRNTRWNLPPSIGIGGNEIYMLFSDRWARFASSVADNEGICESESPVCIARGAFRHARTRYIHIYIVSRTIDPNLDAVSVSNPDQVSIGFELPLNSINYFDRRFTNPTNRIPSKFPRTRISMLLPFNDHFHYLTLSSNYNEFSYYLQRAANCEIHRT